MARRVVKWERPVGLILLVALLAGCASLPDNSGRNQTQVLQPTGEAYLDRHLAEEVAAHPGKSGFILLDNGVEALVARLAVAELAERSIDIQYYLFHNDLAGRLVAYALLRAADRGVRVRMLLDDMDTADKSLGLQALDAHPNIEIRLFNPFVRNGLPRSLQFLTRFGRATRRMHNKSFTFDDQASIVGGRNIGNEYFDADKQMAFGDLDVLAVGPVVKEVSASFDSYWNSELAHPVGILEQSGDQAGMIEGLRNALGQVLEENRDSPYVRSLRESTLADQMRANQLQFSWGSAEVLSDQPEKLLSDIDDSEFHLTPRLAPYIDRLTDEMVILSAYFVPGREGVDFFRKLRARGVRVRILTNSLASTDVALVHAGYARYRKALLRFGVELYELNSKIKKKQGMSGFGGSSRASLHAKAFDLDRKVLFVGSLNLDPRSVAQNTEIGIAFESPELAGELADAFDKHILDAAFRLELYTDARGLEAIRWVTGRGANQRIYYSEPKSSLWQRFWIRLAAVLPIEAQL